MPSLNEDFDPKNGTFCEARLPATMTGCLPTRIAE
jgi:hypothetical protein